MRLALICKRYYTNRDLIVDRFGRLFHLPNQIAQEKHAVQVLAANLRSNDSSKVRSGSLTMESIPLSLWRLPTFLIAIWRRLVAFKPDILMASADSYLGFIGLYLAKLLRVPFVFDVYDEYQVFASGRIPGMALLFRHTIRRSDLVVYASVPLESRYRPLNPKTIVIENGVDTAVFKPLPKADARAKLELPQDEKIVGFFGSIAKKRGVDVLLQAQERLKSEVGPLRILLAGHNSLGLDLNRDGIDYRGMVAQEQVSLMINACDVVVIPYLPDDQVDMSNACKCAEYLACQVPVVATRVSNHADIFAYSPQSLCNPGDSDELSSSIMKQLESPETCSFTEELTWSNLAKRLLNAILTLEFPHAPD